ncbi:substrate-binding domain-containing protein [Nocardia wallacei]|uniref:substrate-binding domain-containing protein n=1 Tax=Nocardia wallacei TaxID=480035 RepID=UPI002457184A|nr:substrate-binding domain-containing protein [Nocardia wallacei]
MSGRVRSPPNTSSPCTAAPRWSSSADSLPATSSTATAKPWRSATRATRRSSARPRPACSAPIPPAGAYHAVAAHLTAGHAPHGLVIGTYGQAAAALRAVTDSGARVPHDIALVGFDGDATNLYGQLPLTTVRQPIDTIARHALDAALKPRPPPHPLEVFLTPAETCGCATGVGSSPPPERLG